MMLGAYPIRHPKDGSILLASFWGFLRLNATRAECLPSKRKDKRAPVPRSATPTSQSSRVTWSAIRVAQATASAVLAVATDIRYGVPLSPKTDISSGDYGALAGAGVVLITSGVNENDRRCAA
jgi:hypothetical protein